MEDNELLEEVKAITLLRKNMKACAVQVSGRNKQTKTLHEKFVKITHPQMKETFYVPAVCLEDCREPLQSNHDDEDRSPGCRQCNGRALDDCESLVHIARKHFLPAMCENRVRDPEDLKED